MKKLFSKFVDQTLLGRIMNHLWFQLIVSSIILFVIIHVLFSGALYSYPYDYMVGHIVEEDIVLQEDYFDQEATKALKEAVQYQIDPIYRLDNKIYVDAKEEIGLFYSQAYDIREEYSEDESIRISVFTYLLSNKFTLKSEELSVLATMDDVDLKLTENYVYDILRDLYDSGITDENVIERTEYVNEYFSQVDQIEESAKPIIIKIVKNHIRINSFIDEVATNDLIEEKKLDIEDVMILKGVVLEKSGDPLSERSYKIINYFNLNNLHTFDQKIPLFGMDLLLIYMLFLMMMILSFLYKGKPSANKHIRLNYVIVIIAFLTAFAFRNVSMYLFPMAMVAMLISILDRNTSGIVYSFFTTILFGIIFDLPLIWVIFTLLGCMLSAMMVSNTYQRSRIFLAGLVVAIINSVTIIAYSMVISTLNGTLEAVMYGFLSGLISAILTVGFLPLFETIFRMLTPFRLLELSNPNHPLMKKLLLESPGTYHHSIMVANLSEAASHAIDANGLIARVGAYFHDVGKIEKPFMFVENQYDGNNPHDQLVPRVSAKIIKSHVMRGENLGREFKLPAEIIDYIRTHHGTTLIRYFYHKANEASHDPIDSSVYTYQGPIPFTKEQAIVMLADSVEAAVRSVKNGDRSTVESLIDRIIGDKIDSHQLDNSLLTFGEIGIIKQSFMSNLSSAFHERIEYPDIKESKSESKGV